MKSAKWVQRVPRSLHEELVAEAKREGVSLNTLVVAALSQCMKKSDTVLLGRLEQTLGTFICWVAQANGSPISSNEAKVLLDMMTGISDALEREEAK